MDKAALLARVRAALQRHAGQPVAAPPEPQPALEAWDAEALAQQFQLELEAVGGRVHRVATREEAKTALQRLVAELKARSFVATCEPVIRELVTALTIPQSAAATADVGISGVRYALAATGTLVLSSEFGRLAPLLPMHHIAIVTAAQLVPSMAEALARQLASGGELPSAWVQVTGPSRTADIELTLTTGVHGPGTVAVILIAD